MPTLTPSIQYSIEMARGLSRWQRSKMGRSPSSPQIHQKYIGMWNNSYQTPSEHWQKTPDFQKGKPQSSQNEIGQKIRIKKETKGFQTGICVPGKESGEGEKASAHLEIPSLVGTGRVSETLGGTQQQVLRRQKRKN